MEIAIKLSLPPGPEYRRMPFFGGFSMHRPARIRPAFSGKPGFGAGHGWILSLVGAMVGVCGATGELKATSYEVGPGLIYSTIASVPALGPGDVVNIHCGDRKSTR